MADALILVEDPMGKHLSLPANLEMSIAAVVEIDLLATQLFGDNTPIQEELLAIVGQCQLLAHMPLILVAQNIIESFRTHTSPEMDVVRPSRLAQRTSR